MNGVLGMTQMLMFTPLSEEQEQFCQTILTSSNALLKLLNDFLDFSKAEAGAEQVVLEIFEIRKLLDDLLNLFSGSAKVKGLKLTAEMDPDIQELLISDPEMIRRILTNLVANAIKFTDAGSVTLRLELVKADLAHQWIRLEVCDTGIGTTPLQQEIIFQPFRQADERTTRKYGGSGLGLSIAKSLVELLGGKIELKSAKDKGSCFSYTLAFERVKQSVAYNPPIPVKQ